MTCNIFLHSSNRSYSGFHLNIAIFDRDGSNSAHLGDLRDRVRSFLLDFNMYNILNDSSNLYFYSIASPNVDSFLQEAASFLHHLQKIKVFGNPESLDCISKHFNEERIQFVDADFQFKANLRSLFKLANFGYSIPVIHDLSSNCDFSPEYCHSISEDVFLVLVESGVTYYFVPFGEGSVMFLGHSAIGPQTLLSAFRLFLKNFSDLMDGPAEFLGYDLDKLVDIAEKGDSTKADVLVSDIYGGGYDRIKLPPNLPASRLGKMQTPDLNLLSSEKGKEHLRGNTVKLEDFASSLLMLLVETVSIHVSLHSRINKTERILLVGSIFRNPKIAMLFNWKINHCRSDLRCLYSNVVSILPILAALTPDE